MAMKIVIVKDATTDHLVPLTLQDSDSIADLIRQWSKACGRDGSEFIFKTIGGEVLSGEVLIRELSVPLSGYSSLEIIAERTARLFVCIKGPGSFGGKMLEIQLALSFTVEPLASVVCQVLQIPDQELEFRTKAPGSSCALPPPLRSDVSLAEQRVGEDEEIDCDFSFDFVASSSEGVHRLTCRGGTKVCELLPGIPGTRQRLTFAGRSLDGNADLVAQLREDLTQRLREGGSRTVRLEAEREVNVRLDGEALTAWSGEKVASWAERARPASPGRPLWHCGRSVGPDATVGSLASDGSREPLVLESGPGLALAVVDVGGQRHELLLHSSASVGQLMQRALAEPGVDLGATAGRHDDLGLFLSLENGRRLSPAHAGLAHCGVESGATVLLRRPTEDLLLECEGWQGRLADVPKAASFAQLLQAARRATGRALDDDCDFACRCGREIARGSALPSSPPCCSASPRLLRLHRRLWVSVATATNPLFTRQRRRATDTVHDVLQETVKRLDPDDGLRRRLALRGDVQDSAARLFELAGDSELTLGLQEEVVFVAEGKKRCHLARMWPGGTGADVRRLLAKTGMVKGKEALQLRGEVVRDEERLQLRNGDVVRVLEEEEAAVRGEGDCSASRKSLIAPSASAAAPKSSSAKRREASPQSFAAAVLRHGANEKTEKKSGAPLSSLSNGRGKTTVVVTESSLPLNKTMPRRTSVRVISRESGVPDFQLELPTPLSARQLRTEVAQRFKRSWTKVLLLQHRASSSEGRPLVDIGNYRWSDAAGRVFPHADVVNIHKHRMVDEKEELVIPGSLVWKVFVCSVK